MLTTLFLQTSANSTGVYIALGGTLAASVIAACASFVASFKSAITSEKVATLSATVARESATLAARTAQELKDKDFRNDYYKKIIDKRLAAYDKVESIVSILAVRRNVSISKGDDVINGSILEVFKDSETFNDFFKQLDDVTSKSLWLSKSCYLELKNLFNKFSDILDDVDVMDNIDDENIKFVEDGIKYFEEIDATGKRLDKIIKREIVEIQDVDKFFGEIHN